MIRHVLFYQLKDTAEGRSKQDNIALIRDRFFGLKEIPEVQSLEYGINFASVEQAFDIALLVQFQNKADFFKYLEHPLHVALGQVVAQLRENWAVVDYEL